MGITGLLAAIAGVGVVALAGVGWKFSQVVIKPARRSLASLEADQIEAGQLAPGEYGALRAEPFTLQSSYGYRIEGEWLMPSTDVPAGNGDMGNASNAAASPRGNLPPRAVVIAHGYGVNRVNSVKYARLFLARGFQVVLYDHGNSGTSGGAFTTMGHREKTDLKTVTDAVFARLGPDAVVGTHGESMGAATVLLHAAMEPRLAFVVADCPYADLRAQLAYRLKVEYRLPSFPILDAASLMARLRAGFLFGSVSPVRTLARHGGLPELPVLFIHGLADDYIPPESSIRLHAAKKGVAELLLMPDARHAESLSAHPDRYAGTVGAFVDTVLAKCADADGLPG